MARYREVSIKVPRGISTRKLQSDVNKLVEERYGRISASSMRKRLGIRRLRSNIKITKEEEEAVAKLREGERTRVRQS
jgi:hypothetical protein